MTFKIADVMSVYIFQTFGIVYFLVFISFPYFTLSYIFPPAFGIVLSVVLSTFFIGGGIYMAHITRLDEILRFPRGRPVTFEELPKQRVNLYIKSSLRDLLFVVLINAGLLVANEFLK